MLPPYQRQVGLSLWNVQEIHILKYCTTSEGLVICITCMPELFAIRWKLRGDAMTTYWAFLLGHCLFLTVFMTALLTVKQSVIDIVRY